MVDAAELLRLRWNTNLTRSAAGAPLIPPLFVAEQGSGVQIADIRPLENHVSDTPMLALSRTIEINLRQQLGETELPDKIEPEDGVLM